MVLLQCIVVYSLLHLQCAAALPQGITPSEVSSVTSATRTGTSAVGNTGTCDFKIINDFFDYVNRIGLNITTEVQKCQNLCLHTYGVGNPDLSGIGVSSQTQGLSMFHTKVGADRLCLLLIKMMYAYTIQTGLTILIGPVYRIVYLTLAPARSFVQDLKDIQTNFFSSNGFFVGSSALATLVNLSQNPSTFEIAEMQAMAFLQVNSILVTFFCLVVAQLTSRWGARVLLYFAVFVLVIVALGKSHLGSDSKANWRLASDGCAHSSTDYTIVNPVLYPSWTVAIFAVAGTVAFWIQSLKETFQTDNLRKSLFRLLMLFWVLLIGLLTAGMVLGLTMMWRQRRHLRSLARDQFEDDQWDSGRLLP